MSEEVSPPWYKLPIVWMVIGGPATVVVAGFATLAVASTLSRLVMYLLCALALPVLGHREAERAPWWHLPVSVLAVISSLWVAGHMLAGSLMKPNWSLRD
jgi:amino acid transporter